MSDELNEEIVKVEGKESTKLFDQSTVDSMIAREKRNYSEKYKDYEELKATVNKLSEEKKAAELASMTEADRVKALLQESEDKNNKMLLEITDLRKEQTKISVLQKSEYSSLPRAYKQMVKSDESIDIVTESAESALKEWMADTNQKAVVENFDTSEAPNETVVPITSPTEGSALGRMRETFQAGLKNSIGGKR
jgi:hypothetical protein